MTNAAAVVLGNELQTVFLDGTAYGTNGVRANFNLSTVQIGATGHAVGNLAGIDFRGLGNLVLNNGQISATTAAMRSDGALEMVNTGSVMADEMGIQALNGRLNLVNEGTISAQSNAIAATGIDVDDLVVNRGTILGNVFLASGVYLYDGVEGRLQGSVNGEAGNDTLLGGAGAETLAGGAGADEVDAGGGEDLVWLDIDLDTDVLDGGDGTDTLRASGSGDARVNLAPGVARVDGAGMDLITGIERVRGGIGDDQITPATPRRTGCGAGWATTRFWAPAGTTGWTAVRATTGSAPATGATRCWAASATTRSTAATTST